VSTPRDIPSPGELLRKYGRSPRKSWGQNFLHAREIHRAIVEAAEVGPGRRVVEIGAGLGTLTMHLLATGADVWAIERDRDLCDVLRAELAGDARFTLFEADAVRFDYTSATRAPLHDGRIPASKPAIVGNLPYQLTGALLFALLDVHHETGTWVVMVQREVGERLASPPGSRDYGAASVTLGRVRRIEKVCHVSRGCFLPPPNVDSMVIRFVPRASPRGEVADEAGFRALVRACFQQRRKTILNGLSAMAGRERALAWCVAAGVDPGVRAETLTPEAFAALQRAREADAHAPDLASTTEPADGPEDRALDGDDAMEPDAATPDAARPDAAKPDAD
jgi:16S rRNA (adenine1518-N6/adenine1519-N6)-dimethyltransferase